MNTQFIIIGGHEGTRDKNVRQTWTDRDTHGHSREQIWPDKSFYPVNSVHQI